MGPTGYRSSGGLASGLVTDGIGNGIKETIYAGGTDIGASFGSGANRNLLWGNGRQCDVRRPWCRPKRFRRRRECDNADRREWSNSQMAAHRSAAPMFETGGIENVEVAGTDIGTVMDSAAPALSKGVLRRAW